MKLYTEEQVRQAFRSGELNEGCTALQVNIDDFIDSLNPIELPTNEEIEKSAEYFSDNHSIYDTAKDDTLYGFREGAKWVMKRIKVG
jgi:hypothetical protein